MDWLLSIWSELPLLAQLLFRFVGIVLGVVAFVAFVGVLWFFGIALDAGKIEDPYQ